MEVTFTVNKNRMLIKRKKTFSYDSFTPGYKTSSSVKRPISTKRETGKLIKENAKTVLVQFDGIVIKRHKVKHNVEINK